MFEIYLREIGPEVDKAIKNCRRRWWIKSWWVKPHLYVVLFLHAVWWYTPYKRALAIIAYLEYQKDDRYKQRVQVFGEEKATQDYVIGNEFAHYYKQLSWRHHIKALFLPFNYLGGLE